MEKYPRLVFLFNRNKQATETKTAPVVAYIRHNGKRKFYQTGVNIHRGEWNNRYKVVKRTDALQLNEILDTYASAFNSFIKQLATAGNAFSFEDYESFISKKFKRAESFIDFCEERILNRTDIRDNTRKTQMRLVNALRIYGEIKTFSDITVKDILAFNEWLYQQYKYKPSAANIYHKVMSTYINIAIRMELLEKNPYETLSFTVSESNNIKYLEENEILAIQKAPLDGERLIRARDLFIFQCYTGLAYVDLNSFDYSKIKEVPHKKGESHFILRGRRIKTNSPYTVYMLKPALEILKKYDNQLPVISIQKYNEYLKQIGTAAETSIRLTSHVARHTFATLCLNKGMNIKTVAKALGHTRVQTTEKYAKLLDRTVEKEMMVLEKKLMQ